jgi:hypothetical protein
MREGVQGGCQVVPHSAGKYQLTTPRPAVEAGSGVASCRCRRQTCNERSEKDHFATALSHLAVRITGVAPRSISGEWDGSLSLIHRGGKWKGESAWQSTPFAG